MELDALLWCCYVCTHCVTEEGTRIARAECEDGAIYTLCREEGTRMARAECEDGAIYIICREEGTRMARAEYEDGAIYHVGRKGPVWHRRSAKTVL